MNTTVRIIEKPDLTDTELNDLFSATSGRSQSTKV